MSKAITKKGVLAAHKQYAKLINAVLKGFNCSTFAEVQQTMNDVRNHGIDGGYGSYCYYSDTHAFAMKHRKQIVSLLEERANDFGQEVVEMVANFGQFRTNKMDNDERKDLYKYLGGGKCEVGGISNLMCWFAVEEVCRWFEEDNY